MLVASFFFYMFRYMLAGPLLGGNIVGLIHDLIPEHRVLVYVTLIWKINV